MISVAEAWSLIGENVAPLASRLKPLGELLGLRLADDVTSRVDSPPFDKSIVDGFAIATSDRSPTLRVAELVTAGAVPRLSVEPGTTIRLMTGAPLPTGADAVVKWEDCQQNGGDAIQNPAPSVATGSCVLRRGAAFHAGQVVLAKGKRLGPVDVALLAEIGQAACLVHGRPNVGVLPTGDELVEAHETPGPGQIRNSNGPMLLAAVAAAGASAIDLGVARDNPVDLAERMGRGLQGDVLLISGGVSAGVLDLVPGVLAELGVREVFHQVRVKPGKPLWFGVREQAERRTLVFGLPGNPVSTLVSFKLFVEPALAALGGGEFAPPRTTSAILAEGFAHRGGRPTYHPCRWAGGDARDGNRRVEPLDWKGSADLAALTRADCLAAFPEGNYQRAAGDAVEVLAL